MSVEQDVREAPEWIGRFRDEAAEWIVSVMDEEYPGLFRISADAFVRRDLPSSAKAREGIVLDTQ